MAATPTSSARSMDGTPSGGRGLSLAGRRTAVSAADDLGAVSAEYACVVSAAVAIAATLYAIATSPGMWHLINRPIGLALRMLL